MKSVAIVGGGNIAHSLAAAITMHQDVVVVTRRPDAWGVRMKFEQGGELQRCPYEISATSDFNSISDADIIFITLPQFVIEETIAKLTKVVKVGASVVFVPAPAKTSDYAESFATFGCKVVGIQRVPFISRTLEYGHLVRISEPRKVHKLVVSDDSMRGEWNGLCCNWFCGHSEYLSSFLTFAFSNSNPLLHPARLNVLLGGGDNGRYKECPYFYAGWTDESSELYVAADKEMQKVFAACSPKAAECDYESVLSHYGVMTAQELTQKIRSIESFKPILAPWKQCDDGTWIPDYDSRYFTEDIPFGTQVIQAYARREGISTPVIDKMILTVQVK